MGTIKYIMDKHDKKKKIADKRYRNCVLRCDKQRILTGGIKLCKTGCEIEYKKRLMKLKIDLKNEKERIKKSKKMK